MFLRRCLLLVTLLWGINAATPCLDAPSPDGLCQDVVGPGSICTTEGICSNIYASGCLNKKLGTSHQKRACNSDDPPEAEAMGHCERSPFNYTEVRIHNANWESSIFYAWALQIMLSERLHVPVTIGLGPETDQNSFYDTEQRFSYSSVAYSYDAMQEANRLNGDCTQSDKECFHVMPEVWNGQAQEYEEAMEWGIIDPVEGDGQVGKISLYIPKHTANRYPELTSFYGLSGEENRLKLAQIFKFPFTWKDYCTKVSPSNCTTPDDFASRPPEEGEESLYFSGAGSYIGYFGDKDENNCLDNASQCTGHIVAPPCSWSTFLDPQLHWNEIFLVSGGDDEPNNAYSYGEMIQVWNAANATNSDVMMWWFTPDATVELFRDSDFEFQPILLPEPTASCRDNRISADARCDPNDKARYGKEEGSCDSEAHALQKLTATSLRRSTLEVPEAERSPAYEYIQNFKISDIDMDVILKAWITRGKDTYGFDAREAICEWVAENIEALDTFIPIGYPRELSDSAKYNGPLMYSAIGIAAATCLIVLAAIALVYYRRKTRVMVFAQSPFVLLLMVGLLFITAAAILYSMPPSDGVCSSRQWLSTVGYTTELVPLLVKLSATNTVYHSVIKKKKRVKISARDMFTKVAIVIGCVLVYLTIWTVLDRPVPVEERVLVNEDEPYVESSLSCASDSFAWKGVAIGWEALLLILATTLAFQTRNLAQAFNESRSLGTMIYSHFLFMVLRIVVGFLGINGVFPPDAASATISFLLSLDVFFAICIYIVPKLLEARRDPKPYVKKTRNYTQKGDAGGPTDRRPRAISVSRDSLCHSLDEEDWASMGDMIESVVENDIAPTYENSGQHLDQGDVEDAASCTDIEQSASPKSSPGSSPGSSAGRRKLRGKRSDELSHGTASTENSPNCSSRRSGAADENNVAASSAEWPNPSPDTTDYQMKLKGENDDDDDASKGNRSVDDTSSVGGLSVSTARSTLRDIEDEFQIFKEKLSGTTVSIPGEGKGLE